MKKTLFLIILLMTNVVYAVHPSHYISLLKEMFTKVTVEKNDKLYRLWELIYPDWSKMKAFENVSLTLNTANTA